MQGFQSRLILNLDRLNKRYITCIWKDMACICIKNLHICLSRYADPANSQIYMAVVEHLHAVIGANLKLLYHHIYISPVCYIQLSICTDKSNRQMFEQLHSTFENYPLSTNQIGVVHIHNILETIIQAILVTLYHIDVDSQMYMTL